MKTAHRWAQNCRRATGATQRSKEVFTGTVKPSNNPFPNFVKSNPGNVFDAFLINDVTITAALKKMHTTR